MGHAGLAWNQSSRCQQIASIPERKDFTWSEKVSLGEELEEVLRPLAKERQGTRTDLQHSGNYSESSTSATISSAADIAPDSTGPPPSGISVVT